MLAQKAPYLVLTFCDQLRRPLPISLRGTAGYLLRFLICLLTMEFILHYMYMIAIKDVKAWYGDTAAELSMIGLWNLIIVWLKVRDVTSVRTRCLIVCLHSYLSHGVSSVCGHLRMALIHQKIWFAAWRTITPRLDFGEAGIVATTYGLCGKLSLSSRDSLLFLNSDTSTFPSAALTTSSSPRF